MNPRGANEAESEFERAFRDPEQVAEEDALEARLHEERINIRRAFIRAQMENALFREWLMEWLVSFGTFLIPVANSPAGIPDPNATYFALGQKQAGWEIWQSVDDAEPELASLMRREARARRPSPRL